jgi:hypothetical protein
MKLATRPALAHDEQRSRNRAGSAKVLRLNQRLQELLENARVETLTCGSSGVMSTFASIRLI